jgi:hypothetical protein
MVDVDRFPVISIGKKTEDPVRPRRRGSEKRIRQNNSLKKNFVKGLSLRGIFTDRAGPTLDVASNISICYNSMPGFRLSFAGPISANPDFFPYSAESRAFFRDGRGRKRRRKKAAETPGRDAGPGGDPRDFFYGTGKFGHGTGNDRPG